MVDKIYTMDIDVSKVKSVNMSRYNDGYNYVSVSSKMSDNEYMNISYEWQGKQIPEFAMNAMEIMKVMGIEQASLMDEDTVSYLERASKNLADLASKMKKKKEEMPMDDEEEDDMGGKKKKGKKKEKC